VGNAKIWWYPEPLGVAEEIDLGRALTSRSGPFTVVRQTISESYTGNQAVQTTGARTRIRVTLENFTDRTVRQKLVALISHMQAGGYMILAEDTAYAVATFLRTRPSRGDTTLFKGENILKLLVNSTTLNGAEVIVQGRQPRYRQEMHIGGTYAAASMNIARGLSYDWSDEEWVMVRHIGCYPALRLPKESRNGEYLTARHEKDFTLDLPLEEAPNILDNLATADGTVWQGTTKTGEAPTIQQLELEAQSEDLSQIGAPKSIGWYG
jgi:hypothetical protein